MSKAMTRILGSLCAAATLSLTTLPLAALVEPEKLPAAADKTYRHADLDIPALRLALRELPAAAAAEARGRLSRMGVEESSAWVDRRSGRFVTLLPSTPLLPGRGQGNRLAWGDLRLAPPADRAAFEKAAYAAFESYVGARRYELGIDPAELAGHRMASHGDGDLVQIFVQRAFGGIPVRGSFLTAVIGQGNLTLLGAEKWGDRPAAEKAARLTAAEARRLAEAFLAPLRAAGEWGRSELLWLPVAHGKEAGEVALGKGYGFRLAWAIKLNVAEDAGSWEVLVDAASGEILASEDKNAYAEAKGGVYPVSNDGIAPDGVEQAGWPMPFLTVNGGTTDTGGNVNVAGNLTGSLSGPFVRMSDNCGAISLTQSGFLDFGTSAGTDCTTPGFGGGGNTHASRSGFYELNKIKEMARGQLPGNGWLGQQLTANMNINLTCNAFWNGATVNFYRAGGGCFNTGEIAAIFDHEWGHGMDANDVIGGIAAPSGEGIADIYSALRLDDSCIGRHFRATNCGGYGNPCLSCTGVREIDHQRRQLGQPQTYTWSDANCFGAVHCVGSTYAEAVWSLWKRNLQAAPFFMNAQTAHEAVTRLTYLAAGNTSVWFSGGPPNGGCAATSGYMNYLAADDDNGNLADGTPHMSAIHAAFNDHQIACNVPAVQNSGCAGQPTQAPDVTVLAGANSASLSWNAVAGASKYQVFRTEGIFACDFGKVKLGETVGTSWTDSGLQSRRSYSYVVIPIGGADTCMGPASSCDTIGGGNGIFEQTDASGKISIAVFERVATVTSGHNTDFAVTVPDDYVVIGGGGQGKEMPEGNLITASYPNAGLTAWLVSTKDHEKIDPVQVRAWAIGLKIAGLTPAQVRGNLTVSTATSAFTAHPDVTATLPAGYVLAGGGIRVDWSGGAGNLATASAPSGATGWRVRSKDQIVPSPATATAYAIGISSSIAGVGTISNIVNGGTSGVAAHPTFSQNLSAGYALSGCGAFVNWSGEGNLLWRIQPTSPSLGQTACAVASKDHIKSSPASITGYAIGLQSN